MDDIVQGSSEVPMPEEGTELPLGLHDPPAYQRMVKILRQNPRAAPDYIRGIKSILSPHASTRGTLDYSPMQGFYYTFEGRVLSNFGAILLEVFYIHFLDQIQYELELLVIGQTGSPQFVRVGLKELRTSKWLDNLGPTFIYEPGFGSSLAILIQEMSLYAPSSDEYRYQGWVKEREDTYIWGEEQLQGENWDAETARKLCCQVLAMLDVASHEVTFPLLAIALLSLVHSRLKDGGTFFKGVCCVVAPTQSYKTSLASLFLSFAAGREVDVNFEATTVAITRTIGNNRDRPTVVDDHKPCSTKTAANEQEKKLSTVIRMASDDSGGIQKAGRQNSTVSNEAQGLVLVTAENIQLQVQSTLARLLLIELDRKTVDLEKLSYFQESQWKYQEFIRSFICYIAAEGVSSFCTEMTDIFLTERNKLRSKLGITDIPVDNRTSDMVTWLWTVFRQFLGYAQLVQAVTPEQCSEYERESTRIFIALMSRQAERVADLDNVRLFFRALQVLLDTKQVQIAELRPRNNDYSGGDGPEVIGFDKQDCVSLKNNVALQHVTAYYRKTGRDFIIGDAILRKALADQGAIIKASEKSYVHRLNVNHKNYQVMKFERRKFYELLRIEPDTADPGVLQSDRARYDTAGIYIGSND